MLALVRLRLDSQLDFLAHGRLDHVLLVGGDGRPVLDLGRVGQGRRFDVREDNVGSRILGVDDRVRRDGLDAGRPDGVLVHAQAAELPALLEADTTDAGQDVGLGLVVGDEDVVGEEFDVVGVHVREVVDQAEEFGGGCGGDEVAGVVDIFLNLEVASGRRGGRVVSVDEPLDFGGFHDWV